MVNVSPEAQSALENLQRQHQGAMVRLKASQVCECGKIGFDLGWDKSVSDRDLTEKQGALTLVYDQDSGTYLDGVEVKYHDELMGKGFTFYNPNLKNGGGCGREFN